MNVLFDLDGTLTNPRLGIVGCIRHALQRLGRDPDHYPNLERFIGPPLLASFTELLGSDSEASSALELYRERFASVGLYENEVYEGIESCLSELADTGCTLMVATSKPQVYAVKIIQHFGLGGYFQSVYGSELDGRLSDKTELISFILTREGLDRASTVMIGDRSHDIVGAKGNEIRSVGVLWGYGSREELSDAGADVICESLSHLSACFPVTAKTRCAQR